MNKGFKHSEGRPVIWAVFLFGALCLSGCSTAPLNLEYYTPEQESHQSFNICHSYGCRTKTRVTLTDDEWARIVAPLKAANPTPEKERARMVESIALMETITGEKAGTHRDVGGATIRGHGPYQLDCIDEAVNTSKYLGFLADESLFLFHDVGTPARRGAFIDGEWPHNTAVVVERETDDHYAIDSWFLDNGQAPAIVPLGGWLDGWRP